MLCKDGVYYMYLRKSRKDLESEQHAEGETLARHEHALTELARALGITVSHVYREIVSGETIDARPQMLQMLKDMEEERPDGVLVMEIPRLARGDTKDQGRIMETFKYCGTSIVTPLKVYDPQDEFDEEYAEYGLFMSRQEYRNTRRRLSNGKTASVKEGKWPYNRAPYGYERVKLSGEKGFTLTPVREEAQVVRLIFRLYALGAPESSNLPVGTTAIARILDDMGVAPPKADFWQPSVIRQILKNPVYAGKVALGRRTVKKVMEGGSVKRTRPVNREAQLYPGRHIAIVEEELYHSAIQKLDSCAGKPYLQKMKSPLAGLVFCGQCGKAMRRRPKGTRNREETLECATCRCFTVSSPYCLVEDRILFTLDSWMKGYGLDVSAVEAASLEELINHREAAADSIRREQAALSLQLRRACEFLERGIYSQSIFSERSEQISARQKGGDSALSSLEEELRVLRRKLSRIKSPRHSALSIAECYRNMKSESAKNSFLKTLVHRVTYYKSERGSRWNPMDCFTLEIEPLLCPRLIQPQSERTRTGASGDSGRDHPSADQEPNPRSD